MNRALARLGDIGDWTAQQVDNGALTTSQKAAVQALVGRIQKGL
ncbi:hypothetical protein [Streptomyces sp. AC555_RSS877]|nr:hypothetical protein [Streptomyces sp. AC555_RSS877]